MQKYASYMHQSIETSAPLIRGSTGDSVGNVRCFYLPDGPAVRSECVSFALRQKIAGILVYTGVRGHLVGNLPDTREFYLGL